MEQKVITAAEFQQLTPAEQDEAFTASIVQDLSQVPPAFLARIRERVVQRTASGKTSPQT